MKILVLVVVSLAGAVAQAQQVVPVFQEAKMKHSVKGSFTIMNNGLVPMPVVVEPKELTSGQDGAPGFKPVSEDVKVELKDTSAVVPPKGQRMFEYKITADRNVAISFFNGMTTGKSKEGIAIRLWIPSTVFSCTDTSKACRVRTKTLLGITQ